jgi:transporter family protein
MIIQPWLLYALLSAAAAACVGIFAKLGFNDKAIDSNLATTIRSVVMTLFLLAVCTVTGLWNKVGALHARALAMIALAGVAGALSWLFYFRAIQLATVAQVAPIDKLSMPLAVLLAVLILGDRPTGWNWLGIALIAGGAVLAALPKQ